MAKAAVFSVQAKTVAVVTLDLGRTPVNAACERIRERAKGWGVDHVMLTASHTHHAPVQELAEAPYNKTIEQEIGESIRLAVENLQPVRIGVGHGEIDVAHNRRKHLPDGRVMMLWRNEERIPTQPVDKEATVIRIDREDGSPLAVLVHFACHPVVMDQSNLEYSADYVGEMARLVKEESGAECLFLQGACGDINPYLDKTPIDEGGVEAMRSVGRTCAETVNSVLDDIVTEIPASPSVKISEKSVEVGLRYDVDNPEQVKILREIFGPQYDVYMSDIDPALPVALSVLVLNDELALVGMPGEVFVQFQLDLKVRSPLNTTLLCGYTNQFLG